MTIKTPVSAPQVSFGAGPPMDYGVVDVNGYHVSSAEIVAALNDHAKLREAERIYKSIYTILGWLNEPPQATIERDLCLMKERIAAIPEIASRADAAEANLAAVRGAAQAVLNWYDKDGSVGGACDPMEGLRDAIERAV